MINWIIYCFFLIVMFNELLFAIALIFDIYTEEEREKIHPIINKIYYLYFTKKD